MSEWQEVVRRVNSQQADIRNQDITVFMFAFDYAYEETLLSRDMNREATEDILRYMRMGIDSVRASGLVARDYYGDGYRVWVVGCRLRFAKIPFPGVDFSGCCNTAPTA